MFVGSKKNKIIFIYAYHKIYFGTEDFCGGKLIHLNNSYT